jgi:hypothetical protein
MNENSFYFANIQDFCSIIIYIFCIYEANLNETESNLKICTIFHINIYFDKLIHLRKHYKNLFNVHKN